MNKPNHWTVYAAGPQSLNGIIRLLECVEIVLNNWESGDLANAVNFLEETALDIKQDLIVKGLLTQEVKG